MKSLEFLIKEYVKGNMWFEKKEQEIKKLLDLHKAMYADGFCKLIEIAEDCDLTLAELIKIGEEARLERMAENE